MASYPSSIYSPRTKENINGVVYDADDTERLFAEDLINDDNEIVAIETELGTNPKNTSSNIAERLKGIRSLSDSHNDVINIKGGNVGIGTTTPDAELEVIGDSFVNPNDVDLSSYTSSIVGTLIANTGSDNNFQALRVVTDIDATPKEGLTVTNAGNVGIGMAKPSAKLDINSDILRLRSSKTPASAGADGNAGDICWDSDYIYICVATDTWKRVSISTW